MNYGIHLMQLTLTCITQGRDTVKKLEDTVFYYETVASKDQNRGAQNVLMTEKLRAILLKVKNEIKGDRSLNRS